MKRKLKVTSFAKILLAVLVILGARYVYLHEEEIKLNEIIDFKKIIEKVDGFFIEENKTGNNKTEIIEIHITEKGNKVEIVSEGKTITKFKNKNSNIADTFLFNISKEKALVGKIIYKKQ